MLPQLTRFKGLALDLLFPQQCLGCGREGPLLCDSCSRLLPRIEFLVCPGCGRASPGGALCAACKNGRTRIDGIRAPYRFEGVVRRAVHELKYHNLRALAAPLAGLMRDYLDDNPLPADILVPVPLHKKRLRDRGYNQAGLLARELGKLTGTPVSLDGLVRTRTAVPQARAATVAERRSNVAGVFACQDTGLRNKRVLLIDDVATTGATLDACAGALKAAGAVSVRALVLAREV